MIRECVGVNVKCDATGCSEWESVHYETRDECKLRLYNLGWRVAKGKHLCAFHVARRHRRRAAK